MVNLDEPVKIEQADRAARPPARRWAGQGERRLESNFDWVLTDAEDASERPQSGHYAAVVTIPKDFSARATSYSKNDDEPTIAAATIDVQTSQVSGIADRSSARPSPRPRRAP